LASVVIEQVNVTRNQQLDLIHFSMPKLRLGFKGDHEALHPMDLNPSFGPNQRFVSPGSPQQKPMAALAQTIRPRQFLCWTELDRVIPGTNALFAMSVLDKSKGLLRERDTETNRNSSDGTSNYNSSTSDKTIALWKIVEEDVQFVIKGESKCVIYRFEWTDEMLNTALTRMRFLIREDDESVRARRESNVSDADRLESVDFA
jgi:hypothetical protein